jgi:hypothetical protein
MSTNVFQYLQHEAAAAITSGEILLQNCIAV